MDVYTGALSEPPLNGSIVGPLLSCLISDQFLRLKKGDSHWYERSVGPQKFTNGLSIEQEQFVGGLNSLQCFFFRTIKTNIWNDIGIDHLSEFGCRDAEFKICYEKNGRGKSNAKMLRD